MQISCPIPVPIGMRISQLYPPWRLARAAAMFARARIPSVGFRLFYFCTAFRTAGTASGTAGTIAPPLAPLALVPLRILGHSPQHNFLHAESRCNFGDAGFRQSARPRNRSELDSKVTKFTRMALSTSQVTELIKVLLRCRHVHACVVGEHPKSRSSLATNAHFNKCIL